jgi:ribosomal protein S12 methylthiotransferase accessory factor
MVNSNGLASGNTFLEAIAAALYEVVERDGVACSKAAWKAGVVPGPVDLDACSDFPRVQQLIEQCSCAGVLVAVYDCTVDTDVPTYAAYVYNAVDEGLGIYCGYGAHLDSEIAMIRAITEALQGRLNFIAGSRDDIFRAAFWRTRQASSQGFAKAIVEARENGLSVQPRLSQANETFEEDVNAVLASLVAARLQQVVVVDLTPPDCPIHVARVVVPGLEGYMHYGYTPGARARRYSGEADR